MSDTGSKVGPAKERKPIFGGCFPVIILVGLLFFVGTLNFPPMGATKKSLQSAAMQTAHVITLAMFQYASDNGQNYLDGKSSTEVFQKLIDSGYVSDSNIFYLPMAGKTKPVLGQKLKPENVSWDITGGGVNAASPDGLPLVFITGYKVSYAPGAAAIPLVKPYPHFGWEDQNRTWIDWLFGRWPAIHCSSSDGIAVAYKDCSATFKPLNGTVNPNNSIPNFISPDFKPDCKTYRQLTPDGPLP